MRSTRLLAPLALLACVAATSVDGAEPGCERWDLEVLCRTDPPRVIVSDPFTATVSARNVGTMVLKNVTLSLVGDLGAHVPAGNPPAKFLVEVLNPGETKEFSASFICDTVNVTRVVGTARDGSGWAVGNCSCTVDVIGLPAIQSEMTDKDLKGIEKGIFTVGESFLYALEVQNDAGTTVTPDLKVVFALPKELEFVSGVADAGVTVTGTAQAAETSAFTLAPNRTTKITLTVKAIAAPTSNLVQARASVQTTSGVELAEETESTTIKEPGGATIPVPAAVAPGTAPAGGAPAGR
jgi:hypothetical protein